MPLAALPDVVAVLLAVVPAGVLLVGVVGLWISVANERKRSQPIVIAHEWRAPAFVEDLGIWVAPAYVTNDGEGAAFNVRFGVELHGTRDSYRVRLEDPETGNRQRVVRRGERVPEVIAARILITSLDVWGTTPRARDNPHPGRVYWARYENAQGKTWETRNPGDRSADLDIRRIQFQRIQERGLRRRLEERARRRTAEQRRAVEGALEESREALRQAQEELVRTMRRAQDDKAEGEGSPDQQ